jgi:hypothetical protein
LPKKKLSKDREGLASYNAWIKDNKKLEKMGMYGADYFVKRVEELEAKVKMLEKKLKIKNKTINQSGWEE